MLHGRDPGRRPLHPAPFRRRRSYRSYGEGRGGKSRCVLCEGPEVRPFMRFVRRALGFLPDGLRLSTGRYYRCRFSVLPRKMVTVMVTIGTGLVEMCRLIVVFDDGRLRETDVALYLFLYRVLEGRFVLRAVLRHDEAHSAQAGLRGVPVVSFRFVDVAEGVEAKARRARVTGRRVPGLERLVGFVVTGLHAGQDSSTIAHRQCQQAVVARRRQTRLVTLGWLSPLTRSLLGGRDQTSQRLLVGGGDRRQRCPPCRRRSR